MSLKLFVSSKPWLLIITLFVVVATTAMLVNNRIKARGDADRLGQRVSSDLSNPKGDQRRVTYGGASFSYSSLLAEGVRSETVKEQRLQSADEKPDSVTPTHVAFHLEGSYAANHRSSFFDSPEIHVYSISDYKKVLAASKRYVEELDRDVQALKKDLGDKPPHSDSAIPVLPWIDAVQAFRSHVKYIEFTNGKGILFLTQYNIEPSIINNDGLAYIFQGITDDGQYYISATFPVSAPGFPKSFDIETFEGYSLPSNFYQNLESNKKAYQEYLARTERKLSELPPDKYQPELQLFEELIRSLRIDSSP